MLSSSKITHGASLAAGGLANLSCVLLISDSFCSKIDVEGSSDEDSPSDVEEIAAPRRRAGRPPTSTTLALTLNPISHDASDINILESTRSSKRTGKRKRSDEIDKGTEWIIKDVVFGPRLVNGKKHYKVWWEGYDADEEDAFSWEPIQNIRGPALARFNKWPERNEDNDIVRDHPRPPPDHPEWKQHRSELIQIENPDPMFTARLVPDTEEEPDDR